MTHARAGLVTLALAAAVAGAACSGGPTTPSGGAASGGDTTTGGASPLAACRTFGNRDVTLARRSPTGAFTHAPFDAGDLALITNGVETNDGRFSYQWIRDGRSAPVYAPADGVLIRIRHKAENLPIFPSDDFDLFFLVACDPANPVLGDTIVRFNHITEPRADIKATYAFGALGAPSMNPFEEHEERQVPLTNIAVRAGEQIGTTTGTPTAHNFDFMISIGNASVCPFTPLDEPHRSALLALLGPSSASPYGPPVPGYPCEGYGGAP